VDIQAIERELSAMWLHATDDDRPVTKVCALNLVIVCQSAEQTATASDLVLQLAARYPHRALVIDLRPDQPEQLNAWVQANCQLPALGRPQVCSEQITIEAAGAAVQRIPGTVLALLVPDVPVTLLWLWSEPFNDPLFTRLAKIANQVIVDTVGFEDAAQGLQQLATLRSHRRRVRGLSWARITPFRELIAQFFDSVAMLTHLHSLERVQVTYAAQAPGGEVEARLLLAWLATRLGWQMHDQQVLRADGKQLTLILEAKEGSIGLTQVELQSEGARFLVMPTNDPQCWLTRAEVRGFTPLQRLVRVVQPSLVDLVAEELRMLGRDHGFEGVLEMASGHFGMSSEGSGSA
jgi:glucose-6-phosphate dehydrogenase assembly protein OpcA